MEPLETGVGENSAVAAGIEGTAPYQGEILGKAEVMEIAEQLEHINSESLVDNLDEFLGFPRFDPHGDPIPDQMGVIKKTEKQLLSEVELHLSFHCVGVKDSSTEFLKYLDKQKIALGSLLKVIDKEDFDNTLTVEIDGKPLTISNKIANNLYVQ